ncbi:MAG: hypothetical protein JW882_02430 [Deltaproteobacteria bacterium]|nr:hypothetical protein [Deltaproteobacteria bacterium]
MRFARYIQQKVRPFPWIYHFSISIYSIYEEVRFFFHAVYTGKLLNKFNKNRLMDFLSRQEILVYPVDDLTVRTTGDLRQWLKKNNIAFKEGGWTFYLPPQDGLWRSFGNILSNYPGNSGLKILKNLRPPNQARYTNHKQNPAPGAALKRLLTPTPTALMRVANYLYAHGLGIRVYDLIALRCGNRLLTCYVVQHVDGPEIRQKDYDDFINRLKSILDQGDLSTIHEETDTMWDFQPLDCNGNLIGNDNGGKPLFVDFQAFFLRNESKILKRILMEIQDKAHFGGAPFYTGGRKYLYEGIPGISIGSRNVKTRWQHYREMLEECGCSVSNRVVYDAGCNTGLTLYNALSCGALWGIGWDMPEITKSAERLLLSLGATRFDLFGDRIMGDYDFIKSVPARFKPRKNGILFFVEAGDHIGLPSGLEAIPWEYMFYDRRDDQDYEMSLKLMGQIPWLKDVEIISHRVFADGDLPKRVVILLRRQQ